jgi:hypothetical protein
MPCIPRKSRVLALVLVLAGCALAPSSDDAGDASFVRQIVPLMLGRPLFGAHEGELLRDLIDLHDRETVVRMLAREREFREHWTNELVDALELQRSGSRQQSAQCFGARMRLGSAGDGGALAAWVRNHYLTEPAPGTTDVVEASITDDPFNLTDVIDSALARDDLSSVYIAYLVPLLTASGGFDEEVGRFFMRTYLNRDLDCTTCHNAYASISDVDYPRTFPLPVGVEMPVLGCVSCAGEKARLYGIFRRDIVGEGEDTVGEYRPWGLTPECGTIATFYGAASIPAQIAGIDTEHLGYPELIAQLQSGIESLAEDGPQYQGHDAQGPLLPPHQALAYMVAASAAAHVWEAIMGAPLTIAHGYARNEAQMELHQLLTETLLASDWSLEELIVAIVTSSHFNRKEPEDAAGTTPFRLPAVYDPFTVPPDDPAVPDETGCLPFPAPLTPECANGQGELVTRFTPAELVSHARRALGWPPFERFPDSGYPSLEMLGAMDSYLSDSQSGARDWGFQSLLAWEHAAGTCEHPNGSSDWIDGVMAGIASYDAAHPGAPLRLSDIVRTVKDRLVQTTAIDMGEPIDDLTDVEGDGDGGGLAPFDELSIDPPDEPIDDFADHDDGGGVGPGIGVLDELGAPPPPPTPENEREGLQALFGTALTTEAANVPGLEPKLRRFCGTLLRSPQKVLKGIAAREPFAAPKLRVCNAGEPCSYTALCELRQPALSDLGRPVTCSGIGGVAVPFGLSGTMTPPPDPPDLIDSLVAQIAPWVLAQSSTSLAARLPARQTADPTDVETAAELQALVREASAEEISKLLVEQLAAGTPPTRRDLEAARVELRASDPTCRESDRARVGGACEPTRSLTTKTSQTVVEPAPSAPVAVRR